MAAPSLPAEMKCIVCHAPGKHSLAGSTRLTQCLSCAAVTSSFLPPAGDYRVETRPLPEVGDGEVLVKVLAVGICAGDAKCYAGAPYFWGWH